MPEIWNPNNHPEIKKGEIFFGNIVHNNRLLMRRPNSCDCGSDWDKIGYKTKRRGNIAYDVNGNSVQGLSPVFIKRSEVKKNIFVKNPDRLWDWK